jgi:hypothetical protein
MIVLAILSGTPVWAYLLLAWLVWTGLSRLREGNVSIYRVVIVPMIFAGWGIAGLAQRAADGSGPWLLAALTGLAIGGAGGSRLQIDARLRRVLRPASAMPLLRNVSIFLAHYALHVAAAIEPARRTSLMWADAAVSGLCAGYFIGWLIRFARAWRQSGQMHRALVPPAEVLLRPPMN